MSRPMNRTVNRRNLLGAVGAGAVTMVDGLNGGGASASSPQGHVAPHPPRSTLELIPARLNYSPAMQVPPEQQADLDAAVAEILEAFRLFSATLTDTQRAQLLFPLDGMERTAGRDASQTPSFCAVLVWCRPAWGLHLGSLSFGQRMACETFLL
ncbi:MAG: hypothetical protein AVDCRST_MAG19-1938, partial [uncultured Thermomicrobiales bacterium]